MQNELVGKLRTQVLTYVILAVGQVHRNWNTLLLPFGFPHFVYNFTHFRSEMPPESNRIESNRIESNRIEFPLLLLRIMFHHPLMRVRVVLLQAVPPAPCLPRVVAAAVPTRGPKVHSRALRPGERSLPCRLEFKRCKRMPLHRFA